MTMVKIEAIKPEHQGYETGYFCVSADGEVTSYNRSMGWLERSDMTVERLDEHIHAMISEGFRVTFESM